MAGYRHDTNRRSHPCRTSRRGAQGQWSTQSPQGPATHGSETAPQGSLCSGFAGAPETRHRHAAAGPAPHALGTSAVALHCIEASLGAVLLFLKGDGDGPDIETIALHIGDV